MNGAALLVFLLLRPLAFVSGHYYDASCRESHVLAMAPAESVPAWAWDFHDDSLWKITRPEWDVFAKVGDGQCVNVGGDKKKFWYWRVEKVWP